MSCCLQGSFSQGLVMVSADPCSSDALVLHFLVPVNWEILRPVVEFSEEVAVRLIVLIKT